MRTLPWLVLPLVGCAEDLSDRVGDADTGPRSEQSVEGDLVTTTIDATSEEAWIAYDLGAAAIVDVDEPWQLAFQRFHVRLGDGLEAVALDGVALEDVTADLLPSDGWITDQPDADGDGHDEYALADWYAYDPTTHVLTPHDRVYAVRSDAGAWALRIESYYDDAGTPAMLTFRWTAVAP